MACEEQKISKNNRLVGTVAMAEIHLFGRFDRCTRLKTGSLNGSMKCILAPWSKVELHQVAGRFHTNSCGKQDAKDHSNLELHMSVPEYVLICLASLQTAQLQTASQSTAAQSFATEAILLDACAKVRQTGHCGPFLCPLDVGR